MTALQSGIKYISAVSAVLLTVGITDGILRSERKNDFRA